MRKKRASRPRRALVLAGGGVTGGLYEVGALLALNDLFANFTTSDFDMYVGTSAGAFISSLLANRMTPERIRDSLVKDGGALPQLSGSSFLSVPWRSYASVVPRLIATLPRLAFDLWFHWRDALVIDTITSLVRILPHGLFTLDGLESYVRDALTGPGRSNEFHRLHRQLLIPATDLDTGEIHVFGDETSERTPISQAVAASSAIPLLFAPVRIGGIDYVDAGVTKTAHAGLAVERGASLVLLINPLRPVIFDHPAQGHLREAGATAIAGQALRIALQRRLHDGLRRHAYEHPDTDIVLLEPYQGDVELFDVPLMTYTLRHEVIRRGYRTTVKTILADFDRFTELFARHGIKLAPRDQIERRARRWSSALRDAA